MKKIIIALLGIVVAPAFAFAAPSVTITVPEITACGAQELTITGTASFEYGEDDTDYLHVSLVGFGPDVELLSEAHTGSSTSETVNWSFTHTFATSSSNVQAYIYDDAGRTINKGSTFVVFNIDECEVEEEPVDEEIPPVEEPPTEEPVEEPIITAPKPSSSGGSGGVGVSYFMWCDELPERYPKVWPYCSPRPAPPPTNEEKLVSLIGQLQEALNKNPIVFGDVKYLVDEMLYVLSKFDPNHKF